MEREITKELIEAMQQELGLDPPAGIESDEIFRMLDRALECPMGTL